MKIARATAWSLLAAMFFFAPAWAQDTQQGPPPAPAGSPMMAGPNAIYRTGPRVRQRVMIIRRRGMMGPGCGMMMGAGRMMGPGGGPMFWRFRARGKGFGAGAGFEARLGRMVNSANFRQRLGITDAQAAKIRQQTTQFQVSQIRGRADLQVDALQLRNLLTAQSPDRAAIDQKLEQISAAQLAQRKQQVDYMLAMREVLTPEQRQKLQQMRQGRMRRSGQRQMTRSVPNGSKP